jgi:hypothetical protein
LSTRAERSHLRWSFELYRGDALQVISTYASPGDVLVVSGTAAALTPRAKLEFAARLIDKAGAVLVAPRRLRMHGPIAAVAHAGSHFIHLAGRLASGMGEQLVIVANDEEAATEIHMLAAVPTKVVRLSTNDLATVSYSLMELGPRLVMADYQDFADPLAAASLMQAAGAPLLLFGSSALSALDGREPSPRSAKGRLAEAARVPHLPLAEH